MTVRIVTIADIFDALTTDRAYRGALSIATAFEILADGVQQGWWDQDARRAAARDHRRGRPLGVRRASRDDAAGRRDAMESLWKGQSARIREMGDGPAGRPRPRLSARRRDVVGRGARARRAASGSSSRTCRAAARRRRPRRRRSRTTPISSTRSSPRCPTPAGLAGFSMGGYVALALARRRQPEQLAALALVDTRAPADDDGRQGQARRGDRHGALRRASRRSPTRWSRRSSPPPSLGNADLVERAAPDHPPPDAARRSRRTSPPCATGPTRAAGSRAIAIPTLVVVGDAGRADAAGGLRRPWPRRSRARGSSPSPAPGT